MKRLVFIFILLFSVLTGAQISNLANLAQGEMKMFSPIYEKENDLYGYFTLFKLDKLSENEEKYEYVILDKNLNNVANGNFVDVAYKAIYSKYYSPDMVDNKLLLTKSYANLSGSVVFTSTRLLHLDENKVDSPFYFEDYNFFEGERDVKTIKKKQRANKFFNIPIGTNNGYIVIEAKKKTTKENPSSIYFYDTKHEKKWTYKFDGEETKSEYNIVSVNDDVLYFSFNTKSYRKSTIELLQIDSNSGQLKFTYLLEDINSKYSHRYTIKKIGERTILTGKISPYGFSGYNKDRAVGLFKIVLDKNGKEVFKKYFLWEDAGDFLVMSEKGKLEAGYKLFAHSYFVFNDERIAVLSEKFKIATNILLGAHVKTESFILLEFDSDFNLTKAETIEKDMSKFSSSDFLFAQYLNNEKDAVFFYQDYQKDSETEEKNWILGIVSIVNGEINHEKIPMSSDDFFIQPYIAKEGYILLREFNKNSDFDKIRLERLNLN